MSSNNWYVITGGPSTGKSTIIDELKKHGYRIVPEAARTVIDEAKSRGITPEQLRADEKSFQETVVRLKEKWEKEMSNTQVTFFDRGMHDTKAYLDHYKFTIPKWIDELLNKSLYNKVFLLDPLPVFDKDYARTESKDFAPRIQELLYQAYSAYSMKPIRVPPGNVQTRIMYILKHVKSGQTL